MPIVVGAKRVFESALTLFSSFWWSPTSTASFGLFRIGVAALALVQLIVLLPHLLNLFGNFGFVQWIILEEADNTWIPSIGKLAVLAAELNISSTSTVIIVFSVYSVSLVALLLGWLTRISALMTWACHTLMLNSGYLSLYGVDTMLQICFFYFLFMPIGDSYSLDQLGTKSRAHYTVAATIALRTFQFHICIIYLNAVISKSSGEGWWTGESIWRALMQPQFAMYDFSWLAFVPQSAMVFCWSVMVLQLTYVLTVWNHRTRHIALAAIIAFHLGIAVLMGLWLFSIIMIIMNFAAFGGGLITQTPVANVTLTEIENKGILKI